MIEFSIFSYGIFLFAVVVLGDLFLAWRLRLVSLPEYLVSYVLVLYLTGIWYGLFAGLIIVCYFGGLVQTQIFDEFLFTWDLLLFVLVGGLAVWSQVFSRTLIEKGVMLLAPSCAGFTQDPPWWFFVVSRSFVWSYLRSVGGDTEREYWFYYKGDVSAFCFPAGTDSDWLAKAVFTGTTDAEIDSNISCRHCVLQSDRGVSDVPYLQVGVVADPEMGGVCVDCLNRIVEETEFEADSDVESVLFAHQV